MSNRLTANSDKVIACLVGFGAFLSDYSVNFIFSLLRICCPDEFALSITYKLTLEYPTLRRKVIENPSFWSSMGSNPTVTWVSTSLRSCLSCHWGVTCMSAKLPSSFTTECCFTTTAQNSRWNLQGLP